MWRSLIRLAPLALAGFRWWQRRQHKKKAMAQGTSAQRADPNDLVP